MVDGTVVKHEVLGQDELVTISVDEGGVPTEYTASLPISQLKGKTAAQKKAMFKSVLKDARDLKVVAAPPEPVPTTKVTGSMAV